MAGEWAYIAIFVYSLRYRHSRLPLSAIPVSSHSLLYIPQVNPCPMCATAPSGRALAYFSTGHY